MTEYFLLYIFLLYFNIGCGQNDNKYEANANKEKYPAYIKTEKNFIEYRNHKIIEKLSESWNKVNSTFVVAHFGDSHVQPDYFSGTVRKKFQSIKGDAGRGLVFPYSIAKTYSQSDYTSSFEGKWATGNSIQIPPRLPVGVSGFAAHTKDLNAAFSFSFKTPFSEGEKTLKVYCDKNNCGYTMTVKSEEEVHEIDLDNYSEKNPFVKVNFKILGKNITFKLTKKTTDDSEFKLYGVSIENKTTGVLYHNLGVGGACFSALNYQKFFEKEFPYLNADLVICDWGGNDFMYKNRIEPELEEIMIQTIKKIRKVNPDAVILFPSAQDINKKGKNVTAAKKYAALARKVALENDCLFYDWYVISGGPRSMFKWSADGIAGKDNVHLNAKGYKLKGELFTEAFLNTLDQAKAKKSDQSLILDNDSFYVQDSSDLNELVIDTPKKEKVVINKNEAKSNKKKNNTVLAGKTYKVKKGDTLSSISRKFGVPVATIKKRNKVKGNNIKIGQILVLTDS
ncbi:MAG: LysM peptidoglycan-binding domain-containing protein [Bacteroidota bacterium]